MNDAVWLEKAHDQEARRAVSRLLDLIGWVRARAERRRLAEDPYVWGPPASRAAFDRWQAFRRAIGAG